jgi:hypothetical protein
LPTNSTKALFFSSVSPGSDGKLTVVVTYRGLANDSYRSSIVIDCEAEVSPGRTIAVLEDVAVETLSM